MARQPTLPRAIERLLEATLGPTRAATAIGDLHEELDARMTGGSALRFPRLWLLSHSAVLVAAAWWTSAPRAVRAAAYSMRDAIRGLRASTRTSALALLILMLGMSAATVTFSVVDHVVFRRLPYADDHRLIIVYGTTPRGRSLIVSPQDYFAFRSGVPAFESVATWSHGGTVSIRAGDVDETVPGLRASASLFDVLKVQPIIGRSFGPEHEQTGAPKVVVLSHSYWQQRFGGDRQTVGRMLLIQNVAHEIIGVLPPGADFPAGVAEPARVWWPYAPRPEHLAYLPKQGRSWFLQVIARLRSDESIEQAAAQVDATTASLASQYPHYESWRAHVEPLRDSLITDVRGWMLLVLGAVGLVLLVACVNVANLQLARSAARARDFAVRASLGATRGRLIHAMLIESVLLALVAGAAGLLVASWGIDAIKAALPEGISRASQIALDGRILAAAIAAAAISAIVFGLVPAWQASRTDIVGLLKSGTPTAAAPRRRWRTGLLVVQIGLMVVLLVGTSLLVASFVRIMRADLGFTRAHLVGIGLSPSWRDIPAADRPPRSRELFRQAKHALDSVPGVAHAAFLAGAGLPLHGSSATMELGRRDAEGASSVLDVEFRRASEEYLEAAGMRVLEGRWLRNSDPAATVVVLDQLAAERLFGGSPAIGAAVLVGGEPAEVVGIVSTVRFEGPVRDARPQIYLPWSLEGGQGGSPMIVVRTSRPPHDVLPAITAAVTPLLPAGSPPPDVTVVDDLYRELTADRRFAAGLMTAFGALALLIGAAGIYSVMASVVAQQTREIGIRTALGATRPRIASLVLSEAARHVALGLAIGLAVAWAISGIFASLVFGVTPTEPALYLLVAGVLATVAIAAAWVPARRASRVDPIVALRE